MLFPEARKICSLQADEKQLLRIVKEITAPDGTSYWQLSFRVSVRLGGTQLHAQIQWDDNVRLLLYVRLCDILTLVGGQSIRRSSYDHT